MDGEKTEGWGKYRGTKRVIGRAEKSGRLWITRELRSPADQT